MEGVFGAGRHLGSLCSKLSNDLPWFDGIVFELSVEGPDCGPGQSHTFVKRCIRCVVMLLFGNDVCLMGLVVTGKLTD